MAPLRKVRAVLDAPAGVRLAPFLPETVARLRACGELDIDDNLAARLCAMSAATTDRRLAGDRARLAIKGRSGTKPGSLLKGQIPVRTWADLDDSRPGDRAQQGVEALQVGVFHVCEGSGIGGEAGPELVAEFASGVGEAQGFASAVGGVVAAVEQPAVESAFDQGGEVGRVAVQAGCDLGHRH